jgi:hypothetical protein
MMAKVGRFLVALIVLAGAYSLGRAQERRSGDFVLKVEGEVGTTTIVCARGCTLQGERDLGLVSKQPAPAYTFGCSGVGAKSCKAEVHGFLQR